MSQVILVLTKSPQNALLTFIMQMMGIHNQNIMASLNRCGDIMNIELFQRPYTSSFVKEINAT